VYLRIVYDFETSDRVRDFAQILQSGLIIIDNEFEILSEFNFRARRQPWVIPNPESILLTGISIDQLENEPMTVFEMMVMLNEILNKTGGEDIRGGYNNVSFDEPLRDVHLEQNLLDGHLARDPESGLPMHAPVLDLMRGIHACFIHRPGLLQLEEKTQKGNVSLTLGDVARQNAVDLKEEDAHEALGDCRGVIGLARLIRNKDPELWEHLLTLTNQQNIRSFIERQNYFCRSQVIGGNPKNQMLAPILSGQDPDVTHIAFDLFYDPADHLNKSVVELAAHMKQQVGTKKNPFVTLKIDSLPLVLPEHLVAESAYPAGLVKDTVAVRADLIKSNPDFHERVVQAVAMNRTTEPEIALEVTEEITAWKMEFHAADWARRGEMVREFPARFAETLKTAPEIGRYREFARRIIYENVRNR
jgi:exodeoxyribonuclease I